MHYLDLTYDQDLCAWLHMRNMVSLSGENSNNVNSRRESNRVEGNPLTQNVLVEGYWQEEEERECKVTNCTGATQRS